MEPIEETSLETVHALPVLPLRGMVVFPNTTIHFDVARKQSIEAIEQSMAQNKPIFLVAQKDLRVDYPKEEDLYLVGTVAVIRQVIRISGDMVRILIEGKSRAWAKKFLTDDEKNLSVVAIPLEDEKIELSFSEKMALLRALQDGFEQYLQVSHPISNDVIATVLDGNDIGYLTNLIAQHMHLKDSMKQKLLEDLNPAHRTRMLILVLEQERIILDLENTIQDEVKEQLDKNQREYYLREQIKVIQTELGDQDIVQEAQEYREKVIALHLEPELEEKLLKEVDRLQKSGNQNAETGVIRTYLDTCMELPWNHRTVDQLDLDHAKAVLEQEHYGLKKVKERILEFLAVKSLTPNLRGQVICLVGPPGIGKTSIAKSIAKAMGRNYVRLSLGGVRDEADIRGHRKTYIGAMPGRIMAGIRTTGSHNPLMLLDEIDKMGNDFRGDPAAAMLEVLDVEQNKAFRDHYIELPFDLSDVLFITTANDLTTIPRALLDRMEVIELSSYTSAEKLQIAKQHLLPKQMEKHGLKKSNLSISDSVLENMISGYTKEAGVRRLEQLLAKICRKAAKYIAEGEGKRFSIKKSNLENVLGPVRFKEDVLTKKNEIGVVNGLAWTSVGGEILQAEVAVIEGTGKIDITGNLGTVMQESAKTAVTFVRSRANVLGIDPMFYKNTDIHIHFPEAAIPKDGPSAGVTITTAIVSALTGAPVRHDVAMTGEVTLRGRVLPIGGLKEKSMAAYQAKLKKVIIPKGNASDLENIDIAVKDHVEFVLAEHMDTVLKTAIDFSKIANKKKEVKYEKQDIQSTTMPLCSSVSNMTIQQ